MIIWVRQDSAILPHSPAPTTLATPTIHGTVTHKQIVKLRVHNGAAHGAATDVQFVHQPSHGTAIPRANARPQAQTGAEANTAGVMIMTVQPVPRTSLGTAIPRANARPQAQTGAEPLTMDGVILTTAQHAQRPSLGTAIPKMTAWQLELTGAEPGARNLRTNVRCSTPKAEDLLQELLQDALRLQILQDSLT
jgi:hypothetical protein